MNVAVCFNLTPPKPLKGEQADLISEAGVEREAMAVSDALHSLGHSPMLVPLGSRIEPFIDELNRLRPEVVFNLCEGLYGESRKEMHVAALYELLAIPFTGSGALCLGLTQDKARTKDLLQSHRLPTPRSVLVRPGMQYPKTQGLIYPLIVKPRFEDASLGITEESIVEDEKRLLRRIRYVHDTYHQGALIEEFIEGREFNAAVLGNAPAKALPVSEIVFRPGLARSIVSYAGKWHEDSEEYARTEPVCPAPLGHRDQMLVQDVALRACKLLECRDYARVDIRFRDGVPYVLEINANPDISPDAGLARSAGVAGIGYPKLIERILDMAIERMEKKRA